MELYDYYKEMSQDIRTYINDNGGAKAYSYEEWYDMMWTADSVTGNGSGSYTFDRWRAEENICHNLDLLNDACQEFEQSFDEALKNGAEGADVTIRCYLLGEVLAQVLSEMTEKSASTSHNPITLNARTL